MASEDRPRGGARTLLRGVERHRVLGSCAIYVAALLWIFRRVFFPGDEPPVYFGWDTLNSYWPDFAFRFRALWQGEWPLWNPYEHGGMPFAARTQQMLFYPVSWLLGLAALPDGRLPVEAMGYFILLHFVIAALGSEALARHLGAGATAARMAGLTVILCAPILNHRNSNFLYPLVWLPWLTLVVDRFLQRPGRATALHLALVGILAGSAASPPGVFNVVAATLLFATLSMTWMAVGGLSTPSGRAALIPHLSRLLSWGTIAVALALGYLAVTYLPALELIEQSIRADRAPSYVLNRALRFKHLASFFDSQHPQRWWFDLFVGLPTLMLILPALLLRPGRTVWVLLTVGLLSLWVAIGDEGGLLLPAVEHVPGFSLNRKSYRYATVFALYAPAVAACGAQALIELAKRRGQAGPLSSPRGNLVLGGGALVASALFVLLATRTPVPNAAESTLDGAAAVLPVVLLVCLAFGSCLALPRLAARWAGLPLGLLMVAHLVHLDDSTGDRIALNQPLELSRDVEYLKWTAPAGIEWRRGDRGPRVGLGSREEVRFAHGYPDLPMELRTHREFVRWARRAPERFGLFNVRFLRGKKRPGGDATRLGRDRWELANPTPLVAHYSRVAATADGRTQLSAWEKSRIRGVATVARSAWTPDLDALQVGGREVTPGQLVHHGVNHVTVEITAPSAGLLVLNEVHYPGWVARVDGVRRPIVPANFMLRGVVVDAGYHRVHFSYEPAGYGLLLFLCGLSVLGCVAMAYRSPSSRPAT